MKHRIDLTPVERLAVQPVVRGIAEAKARAGSIVRQAEVGATEAVKVVVGARGEAIPPAFAWAAIPTRDGKAIEAIEYELPDEKKPDEEKPS